MSRRARRAAVLAAALLSVPPLSVPVLGSPSTADALTARHRPAARSLQAYLLASAPDSLRDLHAHARSIGVLYPTYFNCAVPSGGVTGAPIAEVDAYARAQGIAVLPRFNCQNGATVHLILTEPLLRAATLARLIAIASSPSYRGLNLDFENDGAGDRAALTSFVAALASQLHAIHKRLSVVVVGVSEDNPRRSTGFYDDRALAALADNVFVLAWGAHFERSAPGPIAPLSTVSATATYLASLPHAQRFVLGAPMYGLDWPERGGPGNPATAYQYQGVIALAHAVHAQVRNDPASRELTFQYTDEAGTPHVVWSMDAAAEAALLRIARAHGLAVGLWRLGQEDQALWSSTAL